MKFRQAVIAVLLPISVGLLQYRLWDFISPFVWFLFYPMIFFGPRFTGFWGGLISTALSTVIVWYYFIPPQFSWYVSNKYNLYSAVVFLMMGYFFSVFQNKLKQSQELLEKSFAAEREGNQVTIHHLQEQLALEDISFVALANSLPQIVWVTKANGENIFFNQAWYSYTGMGLDESMGEGWNKPFHPEDQQNAWNAWQNAVNNNGEYSIECRLRRADGAYRWWLIRGIPSIGPSEKIEKWFGTCTDINDIKIALENLSFEKLNLQTIFENSPYGLAIIRADGTFLKFNKKYLDFFGLENEAQFDGSYNQLLGLFDISSVSGVQIFPQDIYSSGVIFDNPMLSQELHFKNKNTGRQWYGVHSSTPIKDGQGEVSGAVLSVQDITLAIQDQMKLASIIKEQSGILNSEIAGIAKTKDRKFLWVNKRFADNYGYSIEELIGKSSEILYPDHVNFKSFGKKIQSFNFEKDGWLRDTLELKRKDGSLGYFLVGGGVLAHGSDESIWISIDITRDTENQRLLEAYSERLQHTMEDTLFALSKAVDMRDPYTSGHQQRVGLLAKAIAIKLGLDESRVHNLSLIGLIHDIGKIGIPSEILSKPSKLSALEYALIKTHVNIGYDILKGIDFIIPVAEIVREHHERFDGSGYPQGLKGDSILLEARIIAVADVIEAMSTHRPYRAALGIDAALEEIEKGRGTKFDPTVVDACLDLFRKDGYHIPTESRLI